MNPAASAPAFGRGSAGRAAAVFLFHEKVGPVRGKTVQNSLPLYLTTTVKRYIMGLPNAAIPGTGERK